jgi:murein DD-endopeptidase MepM/ murein hydrolase activator NlpD
MATYTIKSGDTLGSIAARYGTTYQQLAKDNNIANPNRIFAGQTITVPGGSSSSKPSGGGTGVSDEEAAQYGFAQDFLKSNSEIRNLVKKAVDQGYTLSRFEYELRQTGWYRNRNDQARDWEVLQKTQPREYQERINDASLSIRLMAQQLGVNLTSAQVRDFADRVNRYGWTEQELRYRVGQEWKYNGGSTRDGAAYQAHQEITELGRQYGIKLSDSTTADWARQVATGQGTVDGFRDYIVNQAKGKYVSIADDLDRGLTVDQLFDPYRQAAAQLLGVNADSIDVLDSKYGSVFAYQAPGESGRRAMRLDEWEQMLRTDGKYGFDETQNAQSMAADLAAAIQTDFGAR